MVTPAEIAGGLVERAGMASRIMIAIAGPPGSGKSTLAGQLLREFSQLGEAAIVVPMDGFHFDDAVLAARGHRERKGAPHTFDVAGLTVLLRRIRALEPDVAIPVFDRSLELSRAGAAIVSTSHRFILVEGNFLLLKIPPWNGLRALFDATLMLEMAEAELVRRLRSRILQHGHDEAFAAHWIENNDLPNARTVRNESETADIVIPA